jgi:hypothetical protein
MCSVVFANDGDSDSVEEEPVVGVEVVARESLGRSTSLSEETMM